VTDIGHSLGVTTTSVGPIPGQRSMADISPQHGRLDPICVQLTKRKSSPQPASRMWDAPAALTSPTIRL